MSKSASYNPAEIEPKWQSFWAENKTFKAVDFSPKEKFYALDMFPYPSGSGLHVGHPEGYTATDITCRYKRAKGFNVLHPMGWDAFGLPAEQYAMETGTHPAVTTQKNIDTFRGQIQALGFSYDWDREINTTDESYYKWTQWIFTQLYKKGLAYIDEVAVNWCPALGTVLANEEVINGLSERGSHPVVRKPMRQWMFKITKYAEQLLDGLEDLDWPEGVKEMQRNWIGKSTGAEVTFDVDGFDEKVVVYTTRPDTLFGATYMVLSPEHKLVDKIASADKVEAIKAYQQEASLKSDMDRTELNTDKTGVFIGAYGINPVNGEKLPIWISDYVLATYGTGAIMSVPAHDTRDFEFAKEFDLEIKAIVKPSEKALAAANVSLEAVLAGDVCWTGNGESINSSNGELDINGLSVDDAKAGTIAWLEQKGAGKGATNYKLRDWLFSRQRYWGEPFPVVHMEDGSTKLIEEAELPVQLPEMEEFKPSGTGESPLANNADWVSYTCPTTGAKGRRETNTMPQWAGSCWYYLRYIDPLNEEAAWDKKKEEYWMPVDLYVGGAEHAVLHLLYSRFWHHVLFDLGFVSCPEPYQKLVNQGMILGLSYKNSRGVLIANDKVEQRGDKYFMIGTDEELTQFSAKMSKSLKNVVNPDDIIEEYGADAMRLYEMFMGPLEATKPWQTAGVEGVYRFLHRAWKMIVGQDGELHEAITTEPISEELNRTLHLTIKKVGEDLENMRYNTAISAMMVFVNEFSKSKVRNLDAMKMFVQLLAPFAPHIGEELWTRLGGETDVSYVAWPEVSEAALKQDEIEVIFQINGKVRGKVKVPAGISREDMQALALANEAIKKFTDGKTVIKTIAVPGRLVNVVVK